jgi:uncharacterized membrane protein YecN with MAPEG domain
MRMMTSPLLAAGFWAAILLIGNIALQWGVINLRRTRRIGIGDGNDRDIARAIRVHGNFVENAAFGIAAVTLVALTGASVWAVHLVGGLMALGRALHAYGLSRSIGTSMGRVGGMVLSQTALGAAAVILIWRAFAG